MRRAEFWAAMFFGASVVFLGACLIWAGTIG